MDTQRNKVDELKFDYKIVDINDVVPNDWNPKVDNPAEYAQVLKSIETYGLRAPITTRELNGKNQIIDGFHRWKACKEKGYTKVVINNQGVVPDDEAKRLTIVFQKVNIPFDEIMYGQLIKSLSDEIGEQKILDTLPISDAELQGYLKMADYDFDKEYSDTDLDEQQLKNIRGLTIAFTEEQTQTVRKAIDKIKQESEDETMSDGRAVELISADYLAGK